MTRNPPHPELKSRTPLPQPAFLPMTPKEMHSLGWDALDILLISGDGYVDHPSFAMALLGRWLIAHGYRTGIIAQPRWDVPDDVLRMGRPTLYAGVSAGAIDSMLAHYTAFRKKRHDDAYTPGGASGARPNRAAIVYTGLVRQAFPGIPVILGGIEASLRRITHYDFWTDKLRRSILVDSKADAVVYGMGERAMLEIACRLDAQGPDSGIPARDTLLGTAGTAVTGPPEALSTCLLSADIAPSAPVVSLPSHEYIAATPKELIRATQLLEQQVHTASSWAVQPAGNRSILIAPPARPLDESEMDMLYALPFSKAAHPSYSRPIPADEMIRTSITTHRGCGGGCSFCSLALHQGRRIASRSRTSIMAEAEELTRLPRFTGAVSDVGGPSANMWQASCAMQPTACKRSSCMHPNICPHFRVPQKETISLLRQIRSRKGITHVRVASGVRFDLALTEEAALQAYTMEFTGGQLKVAPEHICDPVLDMMRKPGLSVFERFLAAFKRYSKAAGKEQYVIPYLMSGFPGCTDADMQRLGSWLAERGWSPQQVQCFIPTPGTMATAMFHAETDHLGNPIFVAKTDAQRLRQHAILIPETGRRGTVRKKGTPHQKGRHTQRAHTARRSAASCSPENGQKPAKSSRKQQRRSKKKS